MTCQPYFTTRTTLTHKQGDVVQIEVNIRVNGLSGEDLTGWTPVVEWNTLPPINPAVMDTSDMDKAVLRFEFLTAQTSAISPGDYTLGGVLKTPADEPFTFLDIDIALEPRVVENP